MNMKETNFAYSNSFRRWWLQVAARSCARKSVGGGYWPKDNIGFRASQGKT